MTQLYAARLEGTGPGPTYVCLHGWMGSHRTFAKLAKHARGTFWSVDLPGYGDSPAPQRWDAELVLLQLEQLFDEYDFHDVVLMGNCGGGSLAILLAYRLKDRLRNLVLVEPFGWLPWYFALFTLPLLGPFIFWMSFRNPLGRFIVKTLTRTPENAFGMDTLSPSTAAGFLRMLGRERTTAPMFDLPFHVEIILGAHTFEAVRACASQWDAQLPDSQIRVLSPGNHLLLQSRPDAVARLLEDQLADALGDGTAAEVPADGEQPDSAVLVTGRRGDVRA